MSNSMEHNNNSPMGFLLWGSSVFLNAIAILDKSTISFILGTIVSLLAMTHYIIQIRNNTKKKQ